MLTDLSPAGILRPTAALAVLPAPYGVSDGVPAAQIWCDFCDVDYRGEKRRRRLMGWCSLVEVETRGAFENHAEGDELK